MSDDLAESPVETGQTQESEAAPKESPDPRDGDQQERETVTVTGSRRRGKRKVTKKKTATDAEGYLSKLHITRSEWPA